MPRYFFNVRDGRDYPDLRGGEFEDLDAARVEAVRFVGQLLVDRAADFWAGHEWLLEVADEKGLILFVLIFTAIDSPASPRVLKPRTTDGSERPAS